MTDLYIDSVHYKSCDQLLSTKEHVKDKGIEHYTSRTVNGLVKGSVKKI